MRIAHLCARNLPIGLVAPSVKPFLFRWFFRVRPNSRSALPLDRDELDALANLDALPAKGAILVLGGPKVRGGTGGASRVMALV